MDTEFSIFHQDYRKGPFGPKNSSFGEDLRAEGSKKFINEKGSGVGGKKERLREKNLVYKRTYLE